MAERVTGSFVALITPMNADYGVDFAGFADLLEFQRGAGTSAVLIMGSSGEVTMLSPEERHAIVRETMKHRRDGMQQWYGCTGPTTEATIDYVRQAAAEGGGRRGDRGAQLHMRTQRRHRPVLPGGGGRVADPDRDLQQPAAGEDRLGRGRRAGDRGARERHGAQGEHRTGRPGGPGLRGGAGRVDHVLLLAQSWARRADHEPRRTRHGEHDRQHHPARDGGDLHPRGTTTARRR